MLFAHGQVPFTVSIGLLSMIEDIILTSSMPHHGCEIIGLDHGPHTAILRIVVFMDLYKALCSNISPTDVV